MGSKNLNCRPHHSHSSSRFLATKSSTIIVLSFFLTSLIYLYASLKQYSSTWEPPFLISENVKTGPASNRFNGDLRQANFAWNKLCLGPTKEKLKLAVFSKGWPIGDSPGGMERHASTLYYFLAARGHEIHVFTVPSDRKSHEDIHENNLHVYFAANDHGTLNCTKAFRIYSLERIAKDFDYVHTESVSLPHWRAKTVSRVAATWHGIWYEIMHSHLFQKLVLVRNNSGPGTELQEAMPRLIDEINSFLPTQSIFVLVIVQLRYLLTSIK
ncbi:glycosyltransferase [Lithospermum erythrorhizon]|uniref:Glycosyltransferase n=1 Tax=Lithospermum erythrorhizon TaxID=34254 RepID=A0AAV3P8F2_LITER